MCEINESAELRDGSGGAGGQKVGSETVETRLRPPSGNIKGQMGPDCPSSYRSTSQKEKVKHKIKRRSQVITSVLQTFHRGGSSRAAP